MNPPPRSPTHLFYAASNALRFNQSKHCLIAVKEISDSLCGSHSLDRCQCSVCHVSYPNARLRDLHVLEMHDEMFQVQAGREKMFQCLVLGCEKVFRNAERRERHLMDAHCYTHGMRLDGGGKKKEQCVSVVEDMMMNRDDVAAETLQKRNLVEKLQQQLQK